MHNTDNFGLSQFDATDIFNPMTVNNENAQKIDAQMKLNKDASLGIATELVSQGVHALTRLSDYETCNFFKFTATSNYEAGETFVVDGVQVQAKTVAGSNLASGAYIIGSTVLCELRDALLTVFVPGAQTADDSLALNGHPDTYFGTAEDVAAAQATATAAGNLADQNRADIVQLKSNLTDTFIKKTKLLGRSSNSNVVELNESFKNYDAIYVSSFTKKSGGGSTISTSIFAFSEDINVGDKIKLLQESAYTDYRGIVLTISSETSFTTTEKNEFYITVIGINL